MPGPISARTEGPSVEPQHDLPTPTPASGPAHAAPARNDVSAYDATELRTLLSTDASRFDFFVTEKEAKTALSKLENLAPADFYAAMQSLAKGGQLETLLDKLSWEDQCRFLSMAADKGSLERTPATAGKGKLHPPGQPELFHMSREFPRCLNDLIHEHSKAQYAEFKRDYDAYTQRYQDALGKCGSLLEIQQLGRPAQAGVTREHVAIGDPLENAYAQDWGRFSDASPMRAYEAVANRMSELTGEKRDGTAWFEFKLERSVPLLTTELTGRLGPHEHEVKEKVGVVAGGELRGATVKVKTFSDKTDSVSVSGKGVEVSVTTSREEGYKKSSLKAGPVKVAHEKDGGGVELTPFKVEAGDNSAELGSWAAGNRKDAEIRGGVRGGMKVADVEVKGQVGVGVRVLREETVARALSSSHDVFKVPPELEARVPWRELDPARTKALEKFGWTEAHWATALGGES